MVIPVMVVKERTGELISGPEIITRGVLFEERRGDVIQQAKEILLKTWEEISSMSRSDEIEVEKEVRGALKRFFRKEMGRRPVIIPVVIEM